MRMLIRLFLVVILVCSGAALGAARGQLRIGDEVVLCTGEAVIVETIDRSGKPVTVTHICPDMALSLMAAVAGPAPDQPPVRPHARKLVTLPPMSPAMGHEALIRHARGPPSSV